ncbi:flagellar biosynthesis anti-sigma factor FlgM [Methylocaldum sp. MU1018]
MDIKLQNTLGSLSSGGVQKKANKEISSGAGASDASSTAVGGASSETSLRLSEIKDRLLSESPVDESRVERIAGALQSGSYEINPQRAAEKLIGMERVLAGFS